MHSEMSQPRIPPRSEFVHQSESDPEKDLLSELVGGIACHIYRLEKNARIQHYWLTPTIVALFAPFLPRTQLCSAPATRSKWVRRWPRHPPVPSTGGLKKSKQSLGVLLTVPFFGWFSREAEGKPPILRVSNPLHPSCERSRRRNMGLTRNSIGQKLLPCPRNNKGNGLILDSVNLVIHSVCFCGLVSRIAKETT